jgi:hypothetical protein
MAEDETPSEGDAHADEAGPVIAHVPVKKKGSRKR